MKKETVSILGIESSGATSSISLSRDGELIGEFSLVIKNIHSRLLSVIIQQIIELTSIQYRDLSAIALSAGPGSFTGLRIGYSLAKGLAHALNLPVVEVPTLDIFAYQQGQTDYPVVSLIDAHRGEVFLSTYCWENNQLNQKTDSQILPLEKISNLVKESALFVGPDVLKFKKIIEECCGTRAIFPFPFNSRPEARALQELAYRKYLSGETVSARDCEPKYMRPFKGIM